MFFCVLENSLPFAIATSDDEENIKVELEENTNDILNDIDFSEIDELMQKMGISLGGAADFKAMISDVIAGKEVFSFDLLFQNLKSQFGDLLKEILSPLVMILVIILLCNLMSSLAPARTSGSVSDVIYFACLAVIVIIVSVLVRDIILVSKETIEGLSGQLNAIYPIIITLLTAVGSVQSVATFSPIMVFFSGTLMNIFAGVLFPIFTFLIVSTIVSKLTPKSNLENMSGFLSSTFKWILGGACTVFMTMLSLQGVVAATKDGLSIKAAKYAIKNYIPFLGGYISEGFEIVKAGSLLVKNAVGIVSVVLIFFTIIKPILYLAILSLGLKLVCGISGVVDNLKISGILMSIANCLKFLVAIVIGVACMYFFLLMILIGTGNNII